MKQILITVAFLLFSTQAYAQYSRQGAARYFDKYVKQSSTVSPYLGLVTSQQNASGARGYIPPAIYQNRVRPQLEQRQQAEQQRRQIAQIQTQLNDVKQNFQQRQQNNFGATGHPTRFMLYQQYYPGFARLRR